MLECCLGKELTISERGGKDTAHRRDWGGTRVPMGLQYYMT